MEYPVLDIKATGERIKQLRKQHGLRVEEVSAYMGFESVQAVYKWQNGKSLPTVDNLFALSRLFGVSIEDILVEIKCEDELYGKAGWRLNKQNRYKLVVLSLPEKRLEHIDYI